MSTSTLAKLLIPVRVDRVIYERTSTVDWYLELVVGRH